MKKLFLILFLFINSLDSEEKLDSKQIKELCKAEEKKEFSSTFCWLEKRKNHYNMVYKEIELGERAILYQLENWIQINQYTKRLYSETVSISLESRIEISRFKFDMRGLQK